MFEAIYFDMDGTIADLYNVENWLERLRANDETPYIEAEPLVNMQKLQDMLESFAMLGITIGVISWLAKGSSKSYDKKVRTAKNNG